MELSSKITNRSGRGKFRLDTWPQILLSRLGSIQIGSIEVHLPHGQKTLLSGPHVGPSGRLLVKKWDAIRKILLRGDIAFAEAFISGEIETPDLTELIEVLALNRRSLNPNRSRNFFSRLSTRYQHWRKQNSRTQSRKNISFHYDMGNEFYKKWLDSGMTYSSALFESEGQSLERAQENKYRAVAERLNLKPGYKVLEIGCGWGGFAEFAIRNYDVDVVGITLSEEQRKFALNRARLGGFEERFDVRLQDYRELHEHFDAIVSIEMLEAVGENYWPVYFKTIHRCLKPGGKASLQVITIDESLFDEYRANPDFIQLTIFPGGMLPTVKTLQFLSKESGLQYSDEARFGKDYGCTLKLWQERFKASWPAIKELGYDDRFFRLWVYYLSYCEGGFRAGNIDVCHFSLTRAPH